MGPPRQTPGTDHAARREHRAHPRAFHENRYVYAVLSRRSGGISIGVNLNPDKRCNFDCIYCQVDRRRMPPPAPVNVEQLRGELEGVLAAAARGDLYAEARFRDLPPPLRQVRDIALSGDGEPTQCTRFERVAEVVTGLAARHATPPLPVVLITNATGLNRSGVVRGVDRIMAGGGAIWAKLDAGTAERHACICGHRVPFRKVLDNLAATARRHPVTLQTCLFNLEGSPPPDGEIDAYAEQVAKILASRGQILGIQLYTVARKPAESCVTALDASTLDAIAARIGAALPTVPLHVYP